MFSLVFKGTCTYHNRVSFPVLRYYLILRYFPLPLTEQYVMLGAEEGLFSLLVTDNPEPVMEQVSSRACHWLRVVESALVWLAGSSRHINMTNLVLLFQTDASKASIPHARWAVLTCSYGLR